MTDRPLLVDLFCGVGGLSRGWADAGFNVLGVDKYPQPDYPYEFVQADVFEFLGGMRRAVPVAAAWHASPPCQTHIAITAGNRRRPGWHDDHVNLVPPTRTALAAIRRAYPGTPTVMECGVGKHIRRDVMLCGEMFGLGVLRHRWIEIDGFTVPQPEHPKHRGYVAGMRHGVWREGPYFAVYGEGGGKGTVDQWRTAMGIDWTRERVVGRSGSAGVQPLSRRAPDEAGAGRP